MAAYSPSQPTELDEERVPNTATELANAELTPSADNADVAIPSETARGEEMADNKDCGTDFQPAVDAPAAEQLESDSKAIENLPEPTSSAQPADEQPSVPATLPTEQFELNTNIQQSLQSETPVEAQNLPRGSDSAPLVSESSTSQQGKAARSHADRTTRWDKPESRKSRSRSHSHSRSHSRTHRSPNRRSSRRSRSRTRSTSRHRDRNRTRDSHREPSNREADHERYRDRDRDRDRDRGYARDRGAPFGGPGDGPGRPDLRDRDNRGDRFRDFHNRPGGAFGAQNRHGGGNNANAPGNAAVQQANVPAANALFGVGGAFPAGANATLIQQQLAAAGNLQLAASALPNLIRAGTALQSNSFANAAFSNTSMPNIVGGGLQTQNAALGALVRPAVSANPAAQPLLNVLQMQLAAGGNPQLTSQLLSNALQAIQQQAQNNNAAAQQLLNIRASNFPANAQNAVNNLNNLRNSAAVSLQNAVPTLGNLQNAAVGLPNLLQAQLAALVGQNASAQSQTSQARSAPTNRFGVPLGTQLQSLGNSGVDLNAQRFNAPPPPPPPPPPGTMGAQPPTMNQFLTNLAMQAGLTNETVAAYIQQTGAKRDGTTPNDDTRSLDMELDDAPNPASTNTANFAAHSAGNTANGANPLEEARNGNLERDRRRERDREHKQVTKRDRNERQIENEPKRERDRPTPAETDKNRRVEPEKREKGGIDRKLESLKLSSVLTDENEAAPTAVDSRRPADRPDETERTEKHDSARERDKDRRRKHSKHSRSTHRHHRHDSNGVKKDADPKVKSAEYVRNVQRHKFKERVSGEVQTHLKPYYRKKTISKVEFKEIMSKCVEKIVAASQNEHLNVDKVRKFVDSYVVKTVQTRKWNAKKEREQRDASSDEPEHEASHTAAASASIEQHERSTAAAEPKLS